MKNKKNIVKLDKGVFSITSPYISNSQLILNFNPFVNKIINEGIFIKNCYLLHYQAKPKYFRTWGLYDIDNDDYNSIYSFNYSNLDLIKDITLNENLIKTKPHAVILIKIKK